LKILDGVRTGITANIDLSKSKKNKKKFRSIKMPENKDFQVFKIFIALTGQFSNQFVNDLKASKHE